MKLNFHTLFRVFALIAVAAVPVLLACGIPIGAALVVAVLASAGAAGCILKSIGDELREIKELQRDTGT